MEYSSVLTSYFIVIPIVQKCVPKEKIKHSSWKQHSFLPMVDQQRPMQVMMVHRLTFYVTNRKTK